MTNEEATKHLWEYARANGMELTIKMRPAREGVTVAPPVNHGDIILRIVSAAGHGGIPTTALTRATPKIRAAQRNAILFNLIESGCITKQVVAGKTRPTVVWVARRAP